jgi:hypothetical protein
MSLFVKSMECQLSDIEKSIQLSTDTTLGTLGIHRNLGFTLAFGPGHTFLLHNFHHS